MQAEGDVVRLPVVQEGPLDFATFFADEHRELFRLLCFVTGSRADAAGLMQEAFLKLWERWDQVDRIADPRAYLFVRHAASPVPRGRASASSGQPLPSR
jgi:DNA-directed RNA polymerase specialized sigma24 family protein